MKHLLCMLAIASMAFQKDSYADTQVCDEIAPLLDSGYYFDIADHKPLPDEQRQALRDFAVKVRGSWRGDQTSTHCHGHINDSRPVNYQFRLSADVTTSVDGVFRMVLSKHPNDNQASQFEKLWLTPATDTEARLQHWHTIEFLDPDTLIYSEKYRARNGNGYARLIHEIKKMSYNGHSLTIDRKLYVNGVIAEHSGISLEKASAKQL